jgi:hypothetical protein
MTGKFTSTGYGDDRVDTYSLTSVALSRLMNAAGIREVRSQRVDERTHPYVCEWQFTAEWVQPDSTSLTYSESYEFDVRDWVDLGKGEQVYSARFAEEVYKERANLVVKEFPSEFPKSLSYGPNRDSKIDKCWLSLSPEKKAELTELAEAKALRALTQMRKFVVQRAQTGAMLRTIRKMLNLKSAYTIAELKEPFRVPRSRFDWERLDGILGKESSGEMRQLTALKLLGISPEEFSNFKQLAAPKTESPVVEAEFEDIRAEVVKAEPVTEPAKVSPKPETTTLADDEMDFLGKVVKKTATVDVTDKTIKDWITKYIRGADWGHEKHYFAHLEDHFDKQSAANLTYEQIWALYLHKHKGVEYPFQWVGKEKNQKKEQKKEQKKQKSADPLTKRIVALGLTEVYERIQKELGIGDAETDEKSATLMGKIVEMVQQGMTSASDGDEIVQFAKDNIGK